MPRDPLRTPLRPSAVAAALALVTVALGPAPAAADLDVVFVLDTTGSMSAELREVQERVEQLAVSLARARADERIRFGIVAYRDRKDDYVTRVSPLTGEVETSRAFLASLSAGGGGDGPESVIAGLRVALREMEWDGGDSAQRQIFLIGDAPPHLDYDDEATPEELIEEARRQRIVINAIGCRSLPDRGVAFFRGVAYATEGSYQHIGRVRGARPGALTEAMSRTVAASAEGAEDGVEVPLTWLRHDDAEVAAILVRQGGPEGSEQNRDGDALQSCSLEVRLPPDFALASTPRVRRSSRGLEVELVLDSDSGGGDAGSDSGAVDVFALEECPPLSTPIHVTLATGGR